jgi:prepilin-type N-terminal cleavage/methylation domain-containing protein
MSSRRAFTIIELLVTVAIIALLSSVIIAALTQARVRSRDASRLENAVQLRTALELYQTSTSSYRVAGSGY